MQSERKNKTLGIDLGKSWGWAYIDDIGEHHGYAKYIELTDWGDSFKELLDIWDPDIVVVSQTNSYGHFNAARSMLKQAGVAFYICGKRGIAGVELNDSSARKAVLGKGLKKKEVQALYPDVQPDALDALILARGWLKLNQEA